MVDRPLTPEASPHIPDANELLNSFNQKCLTLLNIIALLKPKGIKSKPQPWINYPTRSLRKACRRAKRKWCKDKLQVSYEMLRETLSVYKKVVKAAKSKYLSEFIGENQLRPNMIFLSLNPVLNPSVNIFPEASVSSLLRQLLI